MLGPLEPFEAESNKAKTRAIKAVNAGEATPEQQKLAIKTIIEDVAKTYDVSFRPGDPHSTSFAEGKRYVGNDIIRIIKFQFKAE